MKESQLRKLIKEELLKESAQDYFEKHYKNMFGERPGKMITMKKEDLFQLMEDYADYRGDRI